MEHEQSTTIPVSPDRLYKSIADLTSLVKFVPGLTSLRKTDPEHVDVEADYDGRHQRGEAYFRTDDDARRIDWGAEGHPYRGWMQVQPEGEGSKLIIHVTTVQVSDIQQYVKDTFESIRKQF